VPDAFIPGLRGLGSLVETGAEPTHPEGSKRSVIKNKRFQQPNPEKKKRFRVRKSENPEKKSGFGSGKSRREKSPLEPVETTRRRPPQ
jgi:hypothetical protein